MVQGPQHQQQNQNNETLVYNYPEKTKLEISNSQLCKLIAAIIFTIVVSTRGIDLLFPKSVQQGHNLQKPNVAMIADQPFYDKYNLVDMESYFQMEIAELCAIDKQYTGCMEAERLFNSFQLRKINSDLNKQLENEFLKNQNLKT